MDVVTLTADNAEEFVAKQPVTAILFFAPADHGICDLIGQFKSVASTFHEHIAFGLIDLTAAENAEIRDKGVVGLTPTLIYYRFGKPLGEDVGQKRVATGLDRDSIVHRYGHTDSWLRLLR